MSNKQIVVNVNSEVKDALKAGHISPHDGVGYLLCIYYGVRPSFIPEELERKILATGILNKDYSTDTIKWLIPLFEEQETGFEWISEWMDLFKAINPERRGVKADVLRRMKKFFVNNPAVRKDEVFKATQNYLKGISSPMYVKKSHKFIYEIDGSSMLKDYVDLIETTEHVVRRNREDII